MIQKCTLLGIGIFWPDVRKDSRYRYKYFSNMNPFSVETFTKRNRVTRFSIVMLTTKPADQAKTDNFIIFIKIFNSKVQNSPV